MMRRSALLGTLLLLSAPLGGCSGLGHFFGDTETLPGANPQAPTGSTENLRRARGGKPVADAILPQPGDVWPGPPQPLPTLGDASRGGGDLGGPSLPRGGSMSMGEQDAIKGGVPVDANGFGGGSGGRLDASMPDPARHIGHAGMPGGEAKGDIVIPNGDGTSTVISPDGTVRTVKGTPK